MVVLHFCDIYQGTHVKGGRVFDVFVEGLVAMADLDIFDRVGEFAALRIVAPVTVTDGSVSIDLRRNKQNPKIR
jgi:hypothetical protein